MIVRWAVRFVLLLSVVAWPLAAPAQQPSGKPTRIGYLSPRSGPSYLDEAFRQGLRDNIAIEFRWGDWKPDRIAALADELVRLKVSVIVCTGGSTTILTAKHATRTIPIVFTVGDAVMSGVVTRLDRPGENLTGINLLTMQLNVKRLELLKAAAPRITRIAVLANPKNLPTPRTLKELEDAAPGLRVKLHVVNARERQDIDAAFVAMAKERAEGLVVLSDPMFFAQRERIVDLAAKYRLPGIFEWREFTEAGGLLSYGANIAEQYRRLATYVDKILKGARPGDLPVEQPTKFELVINLKTARTLGLTIPQAVLSRADHVIQ
jgi:putative ABC transport system substrate-binding protein